MSVMKETNKPATSGLKSPKSEIAARPPRESAPEIASPFAMMGRFAQEMDRIFQDFGRGTGLTMPRLFGGASSLFDESSTAFEVDWMPRIEVKQAGEKLVVRADLPGMSKDDVKVEVTDDAIAIKGERKTEKKEDRAGSFYSECSYGSFFRSIPLPTGADASHATAEFRNGVLEVSVPTRTRTEPRTRPIEIREGK